MDLSTRLANLESDRKSLRGTFDNMKGDLKGLNGKFESFEVRLLHQRFVLVAIALTHRTS